MTGNTNEKSRGLVYPWGTQAAPAEPFQVADGVWWLRFPMPGALDHINLWLLEDRDGWTVVDTCLDLPEARGRWEALFDGFMGGKPLRRVICTHLHPDHIGLAGWLTRRFDCDLWVSREEFLMCHTLADYTGQPAPEVAIRFYRAAGYDEQMLDTYRSRFGSFGRHISALPDSFRRLVDGETIEINDRYWQVIVGSGHSPEHVSLYCPALKLLIAGDQVLPRITPNVSVFPTEPKGDPLKEWLNSCEHIRARLPDNVLVLPAHQAPFLGLHVRLTQIIESHERALVTLFDALAERRRAIDCSRVIFRRELASEMLVMATGETLAHLNCLVGRRMVRRERDADGVDWYVQKPDTVDFAL